MPNDNVDNGRGGHAHCPDESMARLLPRYEFGALNEEERKIFESHLLACDACFAELGRGVPVIAELRDRAGHYLSVLGSERVGAGRLAAGFMERLARTILPRSLSDHRNWRWASVPIGIALLVVAVAELDRTAGPGRYARLASFPTEEVKTTTIRSPGAKNAFAELMEAGAGYLNLHRLAEARRHLGAAVDLNPDHAEANYLFGLCLALSGKSKSSIPYLEKAARLADRAPLRQKALWSLANVHLKSRRINDARRIFESLSLEQGPYAERARAMTAKLPPGR